MAEGWGALERRWLASKRLSVPRPFELMIPGARSPQGRAGLTRSDWLAPSHHSRVFSTEERMPP